MRHYQRLQPKYYRLFQQMKQLQTSDPAAGSFETLMSERTL